MVKILFQIKEYENGEIGIMADDITVEDLICHVGHFIGDSLPKEVKEWRQLSHFAGIASGELSDAICSHAEKHE